MLLNRKMATAIYNFLRDDADIVIPPLRFNFGDLENAGLIFRSETTEANYYFGNVGNLKYSVYYIANSSGDEHFKQLNAMDYILKKINEIKKLKIDGINYNVNTIYINGLPWPQTNWTTPNLDGFDNTSQIYSIDLILHFEKEDTISGNKNKRNK